MEQETFERDMELAKGSPDFCPCSSCGNYTLVTNWTAEGFKIKYGEEETKDLLSTPLPRNSICADGTLEDTDQICLCRECEYHTENWS